MRVGERANLQLRHPGRARSGDQRLERLRGLRVLLGLVQSLGTREGSFEPGALVGGNPAREEAGVDSQAVGEPFDRALCRTRLAALDLRDVFLREAVARELALRQPRGNPKLAEPFPEADSLGTASTSRAAGGFSHGHVSARSSSQAHTSLKCKLAACAIPHLSVFIAKSRSTMRITESLDRAT